MLKVCSSAPVVASNRYAEPASVTSSTSSEYTPTRILFPETDTEKPN